MLYSGVIFGDEDFVLFIKGGVCHLGCGYYFKCIKCIFSICFFVGGVFLSEGFIKFVVVLLLKRGNFRVVFGRKV